MKKLLFLSVFALFTLVSANVFGQSTGTTPAPGATHEYKITPGNVGNTIKWTVTKGGLVTPATALEASISADGSAITNITWGTGVTVGDWYYVHVTETAGTAGCSNEKVLPVHITASPFYLTIGAKNTNQCYANAVTVNLDTTNPANPAITYVNGNAIVQYTVTPNGYSSTTSGYSFDLGIAYGSYTGLTETPAFTVSTGTATMVGTKVSVSDNVPVTITYTIVNATPFTNSSAANAADYTATATISAGKTNNGVTDNNSGAKTGATTVARPNTTGITTN